MKGFGNFLRTTLLGGILFLVPLVALAFIVQKAFGLVHALVQPIATHLPFKSLLGLETPKVVAIGILVLFCFLAGLLAKARFAQRSVVWLENTVLSFIPGYEFIKSVATMTVGQTEVARQVVLVRIEDALQLGFLVERMDDGRAVVFVPDAPNPRTGAVRRPGLGPAVHQHVRFPKIENPNMKTLHLWPRGLIITTLNAFLLTITGNGFAADQKDDPWRFAVTVPIWTAGIEGEVTARGYKADVDVGFDDLWDHLDASFALGLEARKERFGFFGNVGYTKFSAEGTGSRGVNEDAELKFLVSDFGMAYRLMKRGEERPFVLEALGGIRYWYIATDLKVTGPRGNVLVDTDNSHNLMDPIIGLRASQYVAEKWHLDFQGDIGGFGISGDTSDFDWSAAGLVTYDATRRLGFSAGYRALAVDAERHGGAKKKGADIIMHGLLLTAQFKF